MILGVEIGTQLLWSGSSHKLKCRVYQYTFPSFTKKNLISSNSLALVKCVYLLYHLCVRVILCILMYFCGRPRRNYLVRLFFCIVILHPRTNCSGSLLAQRSAYHGALTVHSSASSIVVQCAAQGQLPQHEAMMQMDWYLQQRRASDSFPSSTSLDTAVGPTRSYQGMRRFSEPPRLYPIRPPGHVSTCTKPRLQQFLITQVSVLFEEMP